MYEHQLKDLARIVEEVTEHPFLVDSEPEVYLSEKSFLQYFPEKLRITIYQLQDLLDSAFFDNAENFNHHKAKQAKDFGMKVNLQTGRLYTAILATDKGKIVFGQ